MILLILVEMNLMHGNLIQERGERLIVGFRFGTMWNGGGLGVVGGGTSPELERDVPAPPRRVALWSGPFGRMDGWMDDSDRWLCRYVGPHFIKSGLGADSFILRTGHWREGL